jgi:hypothetical protein
MKGRKEVIRVVAFLYNLSLMWFVICIVTWWNDLGETSKIATIWSSPKFQE